MTNITVLKDENLGGVEREYREVKRKASVGERIKIVDEDSGYAIGTLFTVTDADFDWGGGGRYRDGTGVEVDGGVPLFHERYLALDPTDIIRINDTRFRMVDRKASVGERIIVVNPDYDADEFGYYKTGDIAAVTSTDYDGFGTFYKAERERGGHITVYAKEYRVLEPLTSAKFAGPAPLLSGKPAPDQAAEIIVALTTRVTALEKRVAALESAEVTDEDVAEISRIALDPPVFSGVSKLPRLKSPQEIRDDIVKRAKDDVERLIDECLEAARVG